MAYTTEAKVENMFDIDISGAGSTSLTDVIAAVKAWIDRYCGKTFEAGVAETRYYDGVYSDRIMVDAFIGTPTVELLDSEGDVDKLLVLGQGEDFIVAPYNSTEKNEIILNRHGSYRRFSRGRSRVKVTAVFAFSSTVPADIQLVATRLAGQLYIDGRPDTTSQGPLKSVTLGDYSATYGDINSAITEKANVLGITSTLDLYRDIDV